MTGRQKLCVVGGVALMTLSVILIGFLARESATQFVAAAVLLLITGAVLFNAMLRQLEPTVSWRRWLTAALPALLLYAGSLTGAALLATEHADAIVLPVIGLVISLLWHSYVIRAE